MALPAPTCYRHVTLGVEVTSDEGKKQFRRSEKSSTMLSELLGRAQLFSYAPARGRREKTMALSSLSPQVLFFILFCSAWLLLAYSIKTLTKV